MLAGDGPLREDLQRQVSELRIEDRVRFLGVRSDVPTLLQAVDVFALTSREDPCPLVALDAAALGKPIICFKDAGGIPEIIGDDAGTSVKHGSVEDFADAIIAFHNDRTQLASAGKIARARVESEFTMERSCRTIYETLVKVADREQKL